MRTTVVIETQIRAEGGRPPHRAAIRDAVGGRSVLIRADAVVRIDSPAELIHVNLTRAAIQSGPSMAAADIDPAETLPPLWIM